MVEKSAEGLEDVEAIRVGKVRRVETRRECAAIACGCGLTGGVARFDYINLNTAPDVQHKAHTTLDSMTVERLGNFNRLSHRGE